MKQSHVRNLQAVVFATTDERLGAAVRKLVVDLTPGHWLHELLVGQLIKRLVRATSPAPAGTPAGKAP